MAKTGIQALAKGRSDLFKIDPSDIHEKDGWNFRTYDSDEAKAKFEELVLSIMESGVRQPLTAYWEDGKLWLSDGHRRLKATLEARRRGADVLTVPVQTEDRYSNEADRVFSQIIRNSGEPFTLSERSGVFKRLIDLGWSENDIARKAGFTRAYVVSLLQLNTASAEVRDFVKSGEVSGTLAIQTLKKTKGDSEKAATVLRDAVSKAKASGRSKATAKHVRKREVALPEADKASQAAQIIAQAGVVEAADKVTLVFSKADYNRLYALLNMAEFEQDDVDAND